ncbi:MAG: hypothetical protein ACRDI2_03750 [Chloroflexota bacterium]
MTTALPSSTTHPARSWRRGGLLAVIPAALAILLAALPVHRTDAGPPAAQAATLGTTYFVDCHSGNDSYSGTSESQAWRSLGRASQAWLIPGDALLLKRGCAWPGPLSISWQGNATAPILVSGYGAGELPVIYSATTDVDAVFVTGSYIVLDGLYARGVAPQRDGGCENVAVGQISGFRFAGSAAHNTLQRSRATDLTQGVKIERSSHHNTVVHNILAHNTMMAHLTQGGGDDYGAFGANVHGDDNEIAYNEFTGHDACSYDFTRDGAAVEIYGGQRNTIHHNRASNNEAFTELGDSRTADNTFAYNLVTSSLPKSTFLVVRGASDWFGPTARTRAYNNTVYLAGRDANGVVCVGGCSRDVLTLKNNIIWSEHQVVYADQDFDEGYNLYWRSDGSPIFKYAGMSATSRKADPRFIGGSAAPADFHLSGTSPAIGAGTAESVDADYTTDLDGRAVSRAVGIDIGAYQYGAAGATAPTPTKTAAPTSTPTRVPPTATATPSPTSTSAPPTSTATTATTAPPTKTPVSTPVHTATSVPPTATPQPTSTPLPTVSAPGMVTPAAPHHLQATARRRYVKLTWEASSTANVTYNVYRGTAPGNAQVYKMGIIGTRFDDADADRGRTYYYQVAAQNAAGESPRSNEDSVRAR